MINFKQYLESDDIIRIGKDSGWSGEGTRGVKAFTEKLQSLGSQNPFNPREIVVDESVAISFHISDNEIWLDSLRSFGEPFAVVKIMTKVCKIADETRVILNLYPKPFGQGGLGKNKLVAFYKKFGFKMSGDEMRRTPA